MNGWLCLESFDDPLKLLLRSYESLNLYMNFSLTERLCVMVSKIESNLSVSTQQLSPYPQSHPSHQPWFNDHYKVLQGDGRPKMLSRVFLNGDCQRGTGRGPRGCLNMFFLGDDPWRAFSKKRNYNHSLSRYEPSKDSTYSKSSYSTRHCHAGAIKLNSNISKDPQPHPRHISPLLCTRNGPIVHELNFKPTVQVKICNLELVSSTKTNGCVPRLWEIMACTMTPSPSFQKSTFHPDKLSKQQKIERVCGHFSAAMLGDASASWKDLLWLDSFLEWQSELVDA